WQRYKHLTPIHLRHHLALGNFRMTHTSTPPRQIMAEALLTGCERHQTYAVTRPISRSESSRSRRRASRSYACWLALARVSPLKNSPLTSSRPKSVTKRKIDHTPSSKMLIGETTILISI